MASHFTKGISWDDCEALFEDLWCCSIAKERISIPESTLFSDQIVSEIAVEIKIQKSGVILSSQVLIKLFFKVLFNVYIQPFSYARLAKNSLLFLAPAP